MHHELEGTILNMILTYGYYGLIMEQTIDILAMKKSYKFRT